MGAHPLVPDDEIVVHEPGAIGGKLRTTPFAGRLVDEGADAFLARVPGRDLCDELGLGDDLVSPATPVAHVAAGRHLHRLPPGLVLGVPTDPDALRGSPLVGSDAADRVAAEPTCRARRSTPPTIRASVPSSGLASATTSSNTSSTRSSAASTPATATGSRSAAAAPQIAAAAERSALTRRRPSVRAPSGRSDGAGLLGPPRRMAALVDALVGALADAGVAFTSEAVTDTRDLDADGVVLATPAAVAASIVEAAGATQAAALLAASATRRRCSSPSPSLAPPSSTRWTGRGSSCPARRAGS